MSDLNEILQVLLRIEKLLSNKKVTKKKESNEDSKLAWSYYLRNYLIKYKVEPVRNALVNSMIKALCKRVPEEELEMLIDFYFKQNDSYYTQNYHAVKCLVNDCEKLITRLKSGLVITQSKARQIENLSNNVNESKEYLDNKYRG